VVTAEGAPLPASAPPPVTQVDAAGSAAAMPAETPAASPQAMAAPAPAADASVPAIPVPSGPATVVATVAEAGRPAVVGVSNAGAEAPAADDNTVRVTYVPEVVKNQIREEVKDEVLDQARKENWAGSRPFPDWVSKFTLYGDLRVRYEGIYNKPGNDDTGSFPNFNAINTGAPFDTAGSVFSPQFDVDQNRELVRIRANMGASVDLTSGFTAGLRLATGNDDNPTTENQTLGAANNGQGGDFSKYAVWLDLAYLKYQTGGDPTKDLSISVGRFLNPFFSTTMMWAEALNFDGIAATLPVNLRANGAPNDAIKPFLTLGAFPVFDTDLNFSTNQPAKYPSYDKWLDAAQAGITLKPSTAFSSKTAVAYYQYHNIEGQLSSPFTPVNSSDQGNTDDSRPSFAQNGNTYRALRDIVPGPLNDNGTIDQWQYFGLATPFRDLALTERLEYNQFDPFQISLTGEFVKNLAFNQQAIQAVAVNNLGPAPTTGGVQPFVGGNQGWLANLEIGDAVLQKLGNWNFNVGYRAVESDAVVDGFTDADFGGVLTGTNLKGYTISANLALAPGVWIQARWMDATAIAGPTFKNDTLQVDLNGRF
jgi:hypothetical protein